MIAPALRLLAVAAALAALPQVAAAERLVLSLSADVVTIRSNFTGTDVVLFGAIEDARATPAAANDIVVTVESPPHNLVARRKARVGGMWLNAEAHTFVGVPDYFALLANRPFAEITDPRTLHALALTPQSRLKPGAAASTAPDIARFQNELIRLKTAERLWVIGPKAVDFVTPTLFRATVPLPADVPVGLFAVRATLFRAGQEITRAEDHLIVTKSGFEEQVVEWSENDAVLYGIGSALLAVMFGFLASVAFRR